MPTHHTHSARACTHTQKHTQTHTRTHTHTHTHTHKHTTQARVGSHHPSHTLHAQPHSPPPQPNSTAPATPPARRRRRAPSRTYTRAPNHAELARVAEHVRAHGAIEHHQRLVRRDDPRERARGRVLRRPPCQRTPPRAARVQDAPTPTRAPRPRPPPPPPPSPVRARAITLCVTVCLCSVKSFPARGEIAPSAISTRACASAEACQERRAADAARTTTARDSMVRKRGVATCHVRVRRVTCVVVFSPERFARTHTSAAYTQTACTRVVAPHATPLVRGAFLGRFPLNGQANTHIAFIARLEEATDRHGHTRTHTPHTHTHIHTHTRPVCKKRMPPSTSPAAAASPARAPTAPHRERARRQRHLVAARRHRTRHTPWCRRATGVTTASSPRGSSRRRGCGRRGSSRGAWRCCCCGGGTRGGRRRRTASGRPLRGPARARRRSRRSSTVWCGRASRPRATTTSSSCTTAWPRRDSRSPPQTRVRVSPPPGPTPAPRGGPRHRVQRRHRL
jgi:hypothetical protein